jgi:hypothetical protein
LLPFPRFTLCAMCCTSWKYSSSVLFSLLTHDSITSFNEWGEGTQIEPAAPCEEQQQLASDFKYRYCCTLKATDEKICGNKQYASYKPDGSDLPDPYLYIRLTSELSRKLCDISGCSAIAKKDEAQQSFHYSSADL